MSQTNIDLFVQKVRGQATRDLGPSFGLLNCMSMPDMLKAIESLSPGERVAFSQAAFDGIPAVGCLTGGVLPAAKVVCIDRIKFAFDVVKTRKVPNSVPADLYSTGQVKNAYDYLGITPNTKNIWSTCIGSTCEDARLRKKGDEDTVIDANQTYGQAGWDVAIKYGTGQFKALPDTIASKMGSSLIKKLTIDAHGAPGEIFVNGVDGELHGVVPSFKHGNTAGLDEFKLFDFLNNTMVSDGVLMFTGCTAGQRDVGSTLIKAISVKIKPRKVVAFTTIGFMSTEKQKRGGDSCREPGVRDTEYFGAGDSSEQYKRYFSTGAWDDLSKLPWQSETSPHAKIAQNGVIIRGSEVE